MSFPGSTLRAGQDDAHASVAPSLPFLDPVTTALMNGQSVAHDALGSFPPSNLPLPPARLGILGVDDATAASFVSSAVTAVTRLFHDSNSDPASQIWKRISPQMNDVLAALNVRVGNDGKWYDATSNVLLSQEEADFRAESLMAQLVGAHMGSSSDRYWYDNGDNHRLTSQEAFTRWTTSYGQGATMESVLEQGGSYVPQSVPNHATPQGQTYYGTTYRPTPSPGGKPGIATAGFGAMSPMGLFLIGGAVLFAVMGGRRGRA